MIRPVPTGISRYEYVLYEWLPEMIARFLCGSYPHVVRCVGLRRIPFPGRLLIITFSGLKRETQLLLMHC